MLVINLKKVAMYVGYVLLLAFSFIPPILNNKNNIIATTATPASEKTIVIDAGHGLPDEGAQSANGTTEEKTNLQIALKLQNLLEQNGTKVILTRANENGIYSLDSKTLREKKVSDIQNRVKIGNENSADIFVSIHLNKTNKPQYNGWQCFFNSKNANSINLANQIQTNLNDAIQRENKRVPMKLDSIYIMKNVEIPITIVECGFLSNPEEEKLLLEDEYQNKLAWGIYNGILDYFNSLKN